MVKTGAGWRAWIGARAPAEPRVRFRHSVEPDDALAALAPFSTKPKTSERRQHWREDSREGIYKMTTIFEDPILSPPLIVSAADHHKLTELALADTGRAAQEAEDLLAEMDRASIMPETAVPADVVRMGSAVRYRTA